MCTVTLNAIPDKPKGFVLTSNRDEAVQRETLPPEVYVEKGVLMLYPKDREAGGSWIGISDRDRAICLLNGGFEPHLRKPPYKKSRGLVVKDLLAAREVKEEIQECDLKGVEPFTTVIVDWDQELQFIEFVWDGSRKHVKDLALSPHIWSSSLLYSATEVSHRSEKFFRFKKEHELDPENLLKFHSFGGDQEAEGLVIDRGFLKTCSITQITQTATATKMWYKDLTQGFVWEKFLGS